MAVKWKNDPDLILKKIDAARKDVKDGRQRFSGLAFSEYSALLYRFLQFSPHIPESEARRMLSNVLFDPNTYNPLDSNRVLSALNKLERDFNKLPSQRYVLLTSISMRGFETSRTFRFADRVLIFEKNPPDPFRKSARIMFKQAKHSVTGNLPSNYTSVRVHVSAREIHQAANDALDSFDLLRSIWNWRINLGQGFRMSWGSQKPVNQIVSGPIHTLHFTSGKLATDSTWWYEPSYVKSLSLFDIRKQWQAIEDFQTKVRKRLAKHPYARELNEALLRYGRALDERDWHNSFLRLWTVLELLTHTKKADYATTIRRAAFLFEEREYHHLLLQHLREYRNEYVHQNSQDDKVETYLYQLKRIVEQLLSFHMFNRFGFASISDACRFLDLPFEETALREREYLAKLALKYRGYS